jgi:hypothetical protein
MHSGPPKGKAKKEKPHGNVSYGELEIYDKTYEFGRIRGDFCLRCKIPDGATLKIVLDNVRDESGAYRWKPIDMYYVREDGNRHIQLFGRIMNNTYFDQMTSNRLTSASRNYKTE